VRPPALRPSDSSTDVKLCTSVAANADNNNRVCPMAARSSDHARKLDPCRRHRLLQQARPRLYAKVLQLDASGTLLVEPIERNISYRHVEACEITEHWALSTTPRRVRHAAKQPTLEPQLRL
jgi:hypothetical protein